MQLKPQINTDVILLLVFVLLKNLMAVRKKPGNA